MLICHILIIYMHASHYMKYAHYLNQQFKMTRLALWERFEWSFCVSLWAVHFVCMFLPFGLVSKMASVLLKWKDFEPFGNLSPVFMAWGMNKGERVVLGRRSEVKKGFPSPYGIYFPSTPSGSFGRIPSSETLSWVGPRCLFLRQWSSTGIPSSLKSLWMRRSITCHHLNI